MRQLPDSSASLTPDRSRNRTLEDCIEMVLTSLTQHSANFRPALSRFKTSLLCENENKCTHLSLVCVHAGAENIGQEHPSQQGSSECRDRSPVLLRRRFACRLMIQKLEPGIYTQSRTLSATEVETGPSASVDEK